MSSGPYYYIRDRGPEVLPTESTAGTKAKDRDRRVTYAAGDLAPGFVHEEVNSRLCDEVIEHHSRSLAKDDSEPLFLYYAMLEPHTPWLPEEQFAGKSGAGPYGDYVAQLDHEIGRVLQRSRKVAWKRTRSCFSPATTALSGPRLTSRSTATGRTAHSPEERPGLKKAVIESPSSPAGRARSQRERRRMR